MKKTLNRYWNDSFWRNNALFLAGSLFVAFLNYLYHPILGRLMDVSSFGEVQALLSIFNLIGMLLIAFQIVIINVSANYKKSGAIVVQQFEYLALLFILGVFLLITAGSFKLQHFFNFSSNLPFFILGLALVLSVLTAFRQGYVQGKSNFKAVTLSNIIGALGKLLFSILLIFLGFQTLGAIAGIMIAQFLVFVYIAIVAKQTGFISAIRKNAALPNFKLLRPEIFYLLSVMIVFSIVTLLYTGDILAVKRYFAPEVAGQYAGISAIAKVLFFATASFAGVLLASVGRSYSVEHNKLISRKSLLLVIVVGGLILLMFSLFPRLVISVMIGQRYVDYAHLLPTLALVVFLVSIANLCFYYFLALRQYIVVPIALVGGATTLTLNLLRHDSLELVIQNFMIGSVAVLILFLSLATYYRLRVLYKPV